MVSKQYICRNPSNCSESPGYYESCFDRTSEHATRCTSDCTNVIQNTIDGEYCNTRSETLNIMFDAPCPSSCSSIMKTQVSITIPDRMDWYKKLIDREIPGTCSTLCTYKYNNNSNNNNNNFK